MRCLLLTSVVTLAGLTAAVSAEAPVTPSLAVPPPGVDVAYGPARSKPLAVKRTVYLDHLVLDELKKSNPDHYARIQKVMAASSELCAPSGARLWQAIGISNGSCSAMTLKMSNPPKRDIGFLIDDTWYVALVTVQDAPALRMALPGKVFPANAGAQTLVDPAK
jgi:hypothetical protein